MAATLGATSGQPLGDFNVFVLGDMTQQTTDVEGRVAVAGNATFQDFDIGAKIPGNGEMLFVGGDLSYTRGEVGQGNQGKIVSGGAAQIANVSHGGSQQRDLTSFFTQAADYFTGQSAQLATLTANGMARINFSTLSLTGNHSDRNVFTIAAADLATTNTWQIQVPTTSTVIVNVTGTDLRWGNGGFNLMGLPQHQVLFNFRDLQTLNVSAIGVPGSILAPQAAVTFNNGQINGQLVANSLTGIGQTNFSTFSGALPANVPQAPTPALLPGMLGIAIQTWRKYRHQRCSALK